jgi:hypothetical protein
MARDKFEGPNCVRPNGSAHCSVLAATVCGQIDVLSVIAVISHSAAALRTAAVFWPQLCVAKEAMCYQPKRCVTIALQCDVLLAIS